MGLMNFANNFEAIFKLQNPQKIVQKKMGNTLKRGFQLVVIIFVWICLEKVNNNTFVLSDYYIFDYLFNTFVVF